jgi:hypothetical protein
MSKRTSRFLSISKMNSMVIEYKSFKRTFSSYDNWRDLLVIAPKGYIALKLAEKLGLWRGTLRNAQIL